MTTKPSRLALERALLEHRTDLEFEARERIARWEEEDRDFRAQYPTLASIRVSRPARVETRLNRSSGLSHAMRACARGWRWAPAFSLAGALVVLLVFVLSRVPPGTDGSTDRMKGGSRVEVLVSTDEGSFPFDGRPLQPGDTLVFRTSTERRHLLLANLETSGRSTVIASRVIEPGQGRVLPDGLRLDDFPGAERVFVFLSDEPLDQSRVAELLRRRYQDLDETAKTTLDVGVLPVPAEQVSWLVQKAPR